MNDSQPSSFPKQGEIWLLKNVNKIKEISKDYRPVFIISDDEQNEFDDSIVAVPLTTENIVNVRLFEVLVENTPETGLDHPSKIILKYPFTLNKDLRLKEKLGVVDEKVIKKVEVAWRIAFHWNFKN